MVCLTYEDLAPAMPGLQRYARSLVRRGAPVDAEDLVQGTLARALSKQHLFDGTNLKGWLGTMLHNQYVSEVRSSQRRGPTLPVDDVVNALPAHCSTGVDRLMVRDMERALAALPTEQRQAIMLVALEGMTYEEAASVLALPVGTVRSRLSHGRDALRETLDHPKA